VTMKGTVIAFLIWAAAGLLFVALGIYARFAKKAVGFWANAEMFEVTDIKAYNRAVGRLFAVFGIVFMLLGLPLLAGQNSAWVLLSVLGVMIETISVMAVYTVVIDTKYRKK